MSAVGNLLIKRQHWIRLSAEWSTCPGFNKPSAFRNALMYSSFVCLDVRLNERRSISPRISMYWLLNNYKRHLENVAIFDI